MPKLGHCAARAREAMVWKSVSVAFAISALATLCVHPTAAQEATTAPTCTGCSGSPSVKRQPKPVKPATRQSKPVRQSRSVSKPAARPGIDNEGTWSGVSKGPCILTWRWTVQISNGSLSGEKTAGHVARNGAATGTMVVFGKTYRFFGRFEGRTGGGTWEGPECGGTWTSAKS